MDTVLESIRVATEKLLMLFGVNGVGIPILRHAILLLVSILLAWLSGFICLKVLVPLVGKITRRTPKVGRYPPQPPGARQRFPYSACHSDLGSRAVGLLPVSTCEGIARQDY